MTSDPTIPARLLAEGVGEPSWWFGADGYMHREGDTWEASAWETALVDLSDPQTAFGVATKLDEWERVHDLCHDERRTWAQMVATYAWTADDEPRPYENRIALMIARLTHIGQDHAIRRALGWEVEPGTLARLERRPVDGWALIDGAHPAYWFDAEEHSALAGITDPTAARAAIYEEVTCDQ